MNPDSVRELYEASERSWESTAAQWVTVFDAVKKTRDAGLAPIEQAVWNTYTQARELRKLVTGLWIDAQVQQREQMRREALADIDAGGDAENWIVE